MRGPGRWLYVLGLVAAASGCATTGLQRAIRACEQGRGGECVKAALLKKSARMEGPFTDLYQMGCEAGDSYSCLMLADQLYDDDRQRGLALAERACELGHSGGCGAMHYALKDRDPERARYFKERSCQLGIASSCRDLAGAAPPEPSSCPGGKGGLDREVILAPIQEAFGSFRGCYERELQGNLELGGLLRVYFQIRETGAVGTVVASYDSMNNVAVRTCVFGEFRRLRFPPPKCGGTVEVYFPFIFIPAHLLDELR